MTCTVFHSIHNCDSERNLSSVINWYKLSTIFRHSIDFSVSFFCEYPVCVPNSLLVFLRNSDNLLSLELCCFCNYLIPTMDSLCPHSLISVISCILERVVLQQDQVFYLLCWLFLAFILFWNIAIYSFTKISHTHLWVSWAVCWWCCWLL